VSRRLEKRKSETPGGPNARGGGGKAAFDVAQESHLTLGTGASEQIIGGGGELLRKRGTESDKNKKRASFKKAHTGQLERQKPQKLGRSITGKKKEGRRALHGKSFATGSRKRAKTLSGPGKRLPNWAAETNESTREGSDGSGG